MRPLARSGALTEDRHVNVTPLIDVVMVMIVFFLIVGKLAADQRSDVALPLASVPQKQPEPHTLIVNVGADGTIVVQGDAVAPGELEARIARARNEHADLVVQIRGDRRGAYGAVAPVVAACRGAGVTRVRFAAEGQP